MEDSFQDHEGDRSGCELSDGVSDVAWVEWDQRRGKRLIVLPEARPGDVNGHLASENDELGGDETDIAGTEDDFGVLFRRGVVPQVQAARSQIRAVASTTGSSRRRVYDG